MNEYLDPRPAIEEISRVCLASLTYKFTESVEQEADWLILECQGPAVERNEAA
jgi:hypothetical protein